MSDPTVHRRLTSQRLQQQLEVTMHIRIIPIDVGPADAMTQVQLQPGLVSAYVLRPMDQQQPS